MVSESTGIPYLSLALGFSIALDSSEAKEVLSTNPIYNGFVSYAIKMYGIHTGIHTCIHTYIYVDYT